MSGRKAHGNAGRSTFFGRENGPKTKLRHRLYRADVSIRLLNSHTIAEAPDHIVVMRCPAWVFALQIGWQPQVNASRKTKSGREYADN
jgi:hypothetical protein